MIQSNAAEEICTLLRIASEAVARASTIAIKAYGKDSAKVIALVTSSMAVQGLQTQTKLIRNLPPTPSALSALTCIEPLLAESFFESEPNELFLRPHTPSCLDPIALHFVSEAGQKISHAKQEIYSDALDGAPAASVDLKDLLARRNGVLLNLK